MSPIFELISLHCYNKLIILAITVQCEGVCQLSLFVCVDDFDSGLFFLFVSPCGTYICTVLLLYLACLSVILLLIRYLWFCGFLSYFPFNFTLSGVGRER